MENNWIFPMAGDGSRLKLIAECKQLLVVHNRQVLEWCLLGVRNCIESNDLLHFVVRLDQLKKFGIEQEISKILQKLEIRNDFIIHHTNEVLKGPLLSIAMARQSLQKGRVVVCNTDQFTSFDMPDFDTGSIQGFIVTHMSQSPKASYAEVDTVNKNGFWRATQLYEKKRISAIASSGIYGFKDLATFDSCLEYGQSGPPHVGEEYFIAPSMNCLCPSIAIVPAKFKFDLGNETSVTEFRRFGECFV